MNPTPSRKECEHKWELTEYRTKVFGKGLLMELKNVANGSLNLCLIGSIFFWDYSMIRSKPLKLTIPELKSILVNMPD